jgi:hypothetical protein
MPAQDRARRNQAMPPQHLRQPADEGGEDRAIRPIQARLRIGSAQHGNFVAQHQQLDVLGHRRATKQHQQVQQPDEDKVEQTQRHGARSCLLAKPANLPGQQRGRTSGTPHVLGCTKNTDQRIRGSAANSAASTARSAGRGRGRLTWRRSTLTSWRSTKISTSLLTSVRARSTSSSTNRRASRYTSEKITTGILPDHSDRVAVTCTAGQRRGTEVFGTHKTEPH